MIATAWNDILHKVENFDVSAYGSTRNYIQGCVSRLSPYISRGVLSTKQIFKILLIKNKERTAIIPFLKELAWREFFQRVWDALGDGIHNEVLYPQADELRFGVPKRIIEGKTGVKVIDEGIRQLYTEGYVHNHMRLYIASVVCNIGKCRWLPAARWMYYSLLDADWASNALSWQWVAGCFSSKKYYANQENINTFSGTHQYGTFLDLPYEELKISKVPDVLQETEDVTLHTKLPKYDTVKLEVNRPIYVYNFYNMDPLWGKESSQNQHILLLEPDFFDKYPISGRSLHFLLDLSRNIENLQIAVGSFRQVFSPQYYPYIHYKQHPTTSHYKGNMHPREYLFEKVTGFYPSFSKYWKQCENYLDEVFACASG